MSEKTSRLVAHLRERLQRTIRKLTWADLAVGGAITLGSFAALWTLAVGLEASLWLGTQLRTGLVLFAAAVLLGLTGTFVARPLAQLVGLAAGPSEEEVARTVGEHHPDVADRLVNLLHLAEGRRTHAPAPFVDRAVQHLAERIENVPFEDVEDFSRARRAARWASLPLVAGLAFLLVAPSTFLNASERLLAPRTEFERPAPFQLSVTPGDVRLVKGDSLQVTVRASGEGPNNATLLLRGAEEESSPERIALEADAGMFRHTVRNVRDSLQYRIVAAPVRTSWYTVEVVDRPMVRQIQLEVIPPEYTGRPARQLDPNVGDVTALPGARVRVNTHLGGPSIEEASLVFDDETEHPLELSGDTASGSFVLEEEGSYVIRLQSGSGVSNRDPIRYEVSLQSDARPTVSFLEPDGTAELTPDLTQPLRVQLSDDYGFRAVKLYYRRIEGQSSQSDSSFESIDLPLDHPTQTDQELTHRWLLAQESGLDLERGDRVAYYVEVWDNDVVRGPKSGRTDIQHLRFPSRSEQYDQLDEAQDQTREQMEELQRESESFRQQFRELRDELRRTREADWEDQRQLEQLKQQQEQLDQGVDELSQQVEEQNRQMQQNDLSSSETAEKFRELKRSINEIKSPELQKALQQLEKSMQDMDFRQMQQSLEEVNTNQEQYQQRLERTLDLFKQLKAQQRLEEMARRAEDVRKQEESIAQKTRERMESSSSAESPDEVQREEESSGDSPSDTSAEDTTQASRPEAADTTSTEESSVNDTTTSDDERASEPSEDPSSSDSTAHEDLATEQEQVAQQMKELMDRMQEAQKDMQEAPSAPSEQFQQLNEQLQEQNLPDQMEQTSEQLRKNELQNAQQQQQQMQQNLQQLQQQLSNMEQGMQGQQRSLNMAGLRSALENTLRLSERQEQLHATIRDLAAEGPTVRQYARDQKALSDGLQGVADSLQSIARQLPEMSRAVQQQTGNALRAMNRATSALDEREANSATGHQKTSMMHLNELALLLADLLEQMQQQQGGAGQMSAQQMMQQLQQMSGDQQKLNQEIQNFLNEAQGERLSQDMEERRQQLAEQQRKIKQQLEEMNVGSEAQEQILGDLERIAEQMEESAEDLEGARRNRELLDRQQQILTRLLNAQQSLRTQGKQDQRQGQQAEDDFDRQPPDERSAPEEADQLRRDLIRALEMGYSSDYEELIKRYFELLQESDD